MQLSLLVTWGLQGPRCKTTHGELLRHQHTTRLKHSIKIWVSASFYVRGKGSASSRHSHLTSHIFQTTSRLTIEGHNADTSRYKCATHISWRYWPGQSRRIIYSDSSGNLACKADVTCVQSNRTVCVVYAFFLRSNSVWCKYISRISCC